MSDLTQFDSWIDEGGPAALVFREHLVPVEGADGVFFPATYAPQQGADRDKDKFQGGYNVDLFSDGTNVCLVDSVGSQANRMEPVFARPGYAELVPQVVVTFPEKGLRLNLLYANHRAADAIIRCSRFERDLRQAFQEVLRGNSEPLAKLAPTSLVFGVWDSRDTSAKLPRLVSSTIRAFNVNTHTRSANFLTQMTIDLAKLEIVPDAGSKEGFANALASRAPGGVQLMPNGSIRRDATLALAALRRLTVLDAAGNEVRERTAALRRYILGLSLVALTAPHDTFLRQGCNLVPDTDKPRRFEVVNRDGTRSEASVPHPAVLQFARLAAEAFGLGNNREENFDASLAEKAAEGKAEKLKVEVVSVDLSQMIFTAKSGKNKNAKEISVIANASTQITKGKEQAKFEEVVVIGAKITAEILDGVAVKISAKD